MNKKKTFLTLISLAFATRILLSVIISRKNSALAVYDKEYRIFFHPKKERGLPLEWSREYCNFPEQKITGLEGNLANSSMKLLGTVLLVRHGDRLPISRPPAFEDHPLTENRPCFLNPSFSPSNPLLEPFIKAILKHVKDIKNTINPSLRHFDLLPNVCSDVSVTQTGIVQMLELGNFLGQRYMPDGLNNHPDVVISSSRFARTFQSLLPLLYGFSPKHFRRILLEGISTSSSIYFCDGDSPKNPLFSSYCNCPKAMNIPELRASFRSWDMETPTISYIHRLLKINQENTQENPKKFGTSPVSVTSPSRIWDWLISDYYCSGLPLPCISDESSKTVECINSSVVEDLVRLVDKNHLLMIKDPNYVKATSLAIYPFLSAVNKKFHDLVKEYTSDCSSESKRRTRKNPFVWILSGHDVTIGPLFVALKLPLSRKVPYATRVAFELWVDCGGNSSCCDTDKYGGRPYIRILLNGRDVTGNIGHCGLRTTLHAWKIVDGDLDHSQPENLCPLSYFNHFLKVDFFKNMNGTDYDAACHV